MSASGATSAPQEIHRSSLPAFSPSLEVLIAAGETSGDMHAAHLVRALKTLIPTLKVTAMGGSHLRDAGADVVIDNRELAVVGLVEVLRHYPVIKRALDALKLRLKTHPPDLLILVDYVEFNLKLAAHAKQLGIKVLFYISPQVWAWRQGRVKKIGERIDMMAVIFPFEVEFYERYNVPVRYVGNPLVGKVKASKSREENIQQFKLNDENPIIGIQPGSRKSEISRLLPVFQETTLEIKKSLPNAQFILPVASGIDKEYIRAQLPGNTDIRLIDNQSPYDVMQVCDAILTACGTATLETGLMGIPMAVAYKVSRLSYPILNRLIKIPHVALVNIVAEKEVVKEFIQHDAKPTALAKEIVSLIEDKDYREQIISGLKTVQHKLGTEEGSTLVAQLAFEMLGSINTNRIT